MQGDVEHGVSAGIGFEINLLQGGHNILVDGVGNAEQLDHERAADAGRNRGALVADVAARVDIERVRADQSLVEDGRRQRALLNDQIPLVNADVAALVFDGGFADRVLDSAE